MDGLYENGAPGHKHGNCLQTKGHAKRRNHVVCNHFSSLCGCFASSYGRVQFHCGHFVSGLLLFCSFKVILHLAVVVCCLFVVVKSLSGT